MTRKSAGVSYFAAETWNRAYLSVCLCLSVHLPASLSVSVCVSVRLSVYLSVRLSAHLPASLSVSVCVYLCVCLPVCLPPCLSLSVCLSVRLSVSVCLCLPKIAQYYKYEPQIFCAIPKMITESDVPSVLVCINSLRLMHYLGYRIR